MATNCHREGKCKWPDRDSNPGHLAYRASTLITATEPHGRPVTFGGSVWVRARTASSNGTVSSVPARL